MKQVFIAAASMAGIIIVRMILSAAFSEQIAEVFTKVSVSFLFFCFITILSQSRKSTKSHELPRRI